MTEAWKPVVGYEDRYEVSDQGRIRSAASGCTLSIYTGDHYSKVRLKRNGMGATKNVHSLVAQAFIGPRPDDMEVCHNNGDHHDNRLTNLRYDTHANNQREQVAHGTHAEARRTHCGEGHAFTEDNTLIRSDGGRRCRTCDTARGRRRWQAELERRANV